jgi:hypothetical protein
MSIEERFRFDNTIRGTDADPVNQLFGRLDLDKKEWAKYAIFDPSKNYTRNLIATDDETFTLLLLCWNAGKESPIHDHVSTRVSVCLCVLRSSRRMLMCSFFPLICLSPLLIIHLGSTTFRLVIQPCDGCWVRLCQGRVRETRYESNDETDMLEVSSDIILEGKVFTNHHNINALLLSLASNRYYDTTPSNTHLATSLSIYQLSLYICINLSK